MTIDTQLLHFLIIIIKLYTFPRQDFFFFFCGFHFSSPISQQVIYIFFFPFCWFPFYTLTPRCCVICCTFFIMFFFFLYIRMTMEALLESLKKKKKKKLIWKGTWSQENCNNNFGQRRNKTKNMCDSTCDACSLWMLVLRVTTHSKFYLFDWWTRKDDRNWILKWSAPLLSECLLSLVSFIYIDIYILYANHPISLALPLIFLYFETWMWCRHIYMPLVVFLSTIVGLPHIIGVYCFYWIDSTSSSLLMQNGNNNRQWNVKKYWTKEKGFVVLPVPRCWHCRYNTFWDIQIHFPFTPSPPNFGSLQ